MSRRLNGWQRLWVVASILYLILVGTITVMVVSSELPTQARILGDWRDEAFVAIRDGLPPGVRAITSAPGRTEIQLWDGRKLYTSKEVTPDEMKEVLSKLGEADTLQKQREWSIAELRDAYADMPAQAVITAIERNYYQVPSISTRLAALSSKYQAELAKLPWQRMQAGVRMGGIALAVWLVPCLAVYTFGLGVAWIIRGFKRQADPPR